MAVLHTGSLHDFILVDLGSDGFVHHQIAQHFHQLFRGDSAGTQQPGAFLGQIHDGRFHTYPTGTAVHHGGNFSVMIVEHVFCGGGGGLAGDVGGRGGDGNAGQADDFSGHIAVGAADSHGGKSAGGPLWHDIPGGENDGQRAGPEFFRKIIGFLGNMVAEQFNLLRAADMQDQRIVLRAAFGFENFRHGSFVQTVGAKTVDGFGGNGNELSHADHFRSKNRGIRIRGSEK